MNLILAFPRKEDAKKIQEALTRHGFQVDLVCTTASAALSAMNNLDGGILVTGYKLPDMFFADLRDCMPSSFEMLLVASNRVLSAMEGSGIMAVSIPLSVYELVSTLQLMQRNRERRKRKASGKPKERPKEQQKLIDDAKALLIDRNHFTEEEAHRYMQKSSMDNGYSMVETAKMILMLLDRNA